MYLTVCHDTFSQSLITAAASINYQLDTSEENAKLFNSIFMTEFVQ